MPDSPVGIESLAQVGADGDEPRFEKLGVPDREDPIGQVNVATPKPERFTGTEPGAVEHQEQSAEREGLLR